MNVTGMFCCCGESSVCNDPMPRLLQRAFHIVSLVKSVLFAMSGEDSTHSNCWRQPKIAD